MNKGKIVQVMGPVTHRRTERQKAGHGGGSAYR